MPWRVKLARRLRSLFRKERLEQELDEELRFHLDCQIEANLAQGMSREEARHAALRSMGGLEQIKEHRREVEDELHRLEELLNQAETDGDQE